MLLEVSPGKCQSKQVSALPEKTRVLLLEALKCFNTLDFFFLPPPSLIICLLCTEFAKSSLCPRFSARSLLAEVLHGSWAAGTCSIPGLCLS